MCFRVQPLAVAARGLLKMEAELGSSGKACVKLPGTGSRWVQWEQSVEAVFTL